VALDGIVAGDGHVHVRLAETLVNQYERHVLEAAKLSRRNGILEKVTPVHPSTPLVEALV
jgi:hypothetical protein